MQTMRESWTDERLDDLKESLELRFDFVDQRFDFVDQRFDRLESDIRELRKTMIYGFFALATMMFTGFAGLAFL